MHELLFEYFQEKTNISRRQFQDICPFFEPKRVKKKELLLMEYDVCRYIFFVNHGCLQLYSIDEAGQELTRYLAFERKFATALTSFIRQAPSFEYIQAVVDTELLRITYENFYHLVDTNPAVRFVYRGILENAYITSQERIYNFLGKTAREKLRWLLVSQPDIFNRLPNQVIASYLGMTPYTLSRLKADL